jgi:hypothetical protein
MIKSIRMRWAGNVAYIWGREEVHTMYRVLVGKSEGTRPFGRPRRSWEYNTKMDLQEVGCGGMDWIDLALNGERFQALVNEVMNLPVPQNKGNFLTT